MRGEGVVECGGFQMESTVEAEQTPRPVSRVLVTGISGNLGRRLAPLLAGYEIISVDLFPPPPEIPAGRFVQLDLSEVEGQQRLAQLLEDDPVESIFHLAFVIDPVRTGITETDRMWRANVGATQELLNAVARVNRNGPRIQLVVFPSSVSVYGPDLPPFVTEDAPLNANSLPYAVHKRECDQICQQMFPKLGGAALYVFRPHIFVGPSVDNYIVRAVRGRASGRGWLARAFERSGMRLPMLLPKGAGGENLFQFIHVDDVARVLAWTLGHFERGRLKILNLSGHGEPISLDECAKLAGTRVLHLPGEGMVRGLLRIFWSLGLSGVPPEALPYFLGSYTMSTKRLQEELGGRYPDVIRFSSRAALEDALRSN